LSFKNIFEKVVVGTLSIAAYEIILKPILKKGN